MKQRRSRSSYERYTPPEPPRTKDSPFNFNYLTLAILGGVFIIGIGVGIAFSTTQSFDSPNVVSREAIDRSAPNPELCAQYGASAIVTDMRVFVTLNPFNVFVTQPSMQPGCVLRRNNWSILEKQKLVNSEEVRDCKQRMNTFGFIGTLESDPKITCIYQNDRAGNLFLPESGVTSGKSETDQF